MTETEQLLEELRRIRKSVEFQELYLYYAIPLDLDANPEYDSTHPMVMRLFHRQRDLGQRLREDPLP